MLAPIATTLSGLISDKGDLLKKSFTDCITKGTLVDPPTKIISSKSSTESLESLSTFLLISNVSSTRFFIKLLKSSRLKINSLLSIPIFSKFTENSEFFER